MSRSKLEQVPYQHSYVQKLDRLASKMAKMADQVLVESLDLTFSQRQVLATLRQHPLFSQSQIAEAMGVTPAVVTRQALALVDKKLLTQERSQVNRRQNLIALTKTGEQAADRGNDELARQFKRPMGLLRGGDQALFERCLDLLDQGLDEE